MRRNLEVNLLVLLGVLSLLGRALPAHAASGPGQCFAPTLGFQA